MAGLPEGWEWDYDGKRWFYKYKPTGHIQYHFPKEGDEFPDFVDASAPAPDLAPEERLESQQQMRRYGSTTTPSANMRAKKEEEGWQSRMSATARPVSAMWEPDQDENEAVFQPENFMYLGPGAYNDVSPLAEEEEEAAKRIVAGGIEDRFDKSPAKGVSPITSAGATPARASAQTEPVTGEPVMVPPTVPEETQEFIHELPVAEPNPDPVGIIAEMPTHDTAAAHVETNPPPIEMADNMVLAPIETAFPDVAELPEQSSPKGPKKEEPQHAPGSLRNYGAQMQPLRVEKKPVEETPPGFQPYKPGAAGKAPDVPRIPTPLREEARPPSVDPNIPRMLSPPVPPKYPLDQPKAPSPISIDSGLSQPPQGNLSYVPSVLKAGRNGNRKDSVAAASPLSVSPEDDDKGSLMPGQQGELAHMPSVLKPARGRAPSQPGQQPQIQPGAIPGQGHGYKPPAHGKHPASMTPAPQVQQQRLEEPRMGIQRVNTVPDSLPSQKPASTIQAGYQGSQAVNQAQQPMRPASVMPNMMGGQHQPQRQDSGFSVHQNANLPYRGQIDNMPSTAPPPKSQAAPFARPATQAPPYPDNQLPYPDDPPPRRNTQLPYPDDPPQQKPLPNIPPLGAGMPYNRRHSSFSPADVSPITSRHGSMSSMAPLQTPSPMEHSRRGSSSASLNQPNYTPSPVSQSSSSVYGFTPTPPSAPANQPQQGSYFTMQDVEGQGHAVTAQNMLRKKSLSRGAPDARRSSVGPDQMAAMRGSPLSSPPTTESYGNLSRSQSLRQTSQGSVVPQQQVPAAPTPPPQGQQHLGRIEENDETASATVSRSSTLSGSPGRRRSSLASPVQQSPAGSRRTSWQAESPRLASPAQAQGQYNPQNQLPPQSHMGQQGQFMPLGQGNPPVPGQMPTQGPAKLQRKPSKGQAPMPQGQPHYPNQMPAQGQVPTQGPSRPLGQPPYPDPMPAQGRPQGPMSPQGQMPPQAFPQQQGPRPPVQSQTPPPGQMPQKGPNKLQRKPSKGQAPYPPVQGQPQPQGAPMPGQGPVPGQIPPGHYPQGQMPPGVMPPSQAHNGRMHPQIQIPQNQQPWPPGMQPPMGQGSRPGSVPPQATQSAGPKEGKEGKKWLKFWKAGAKSATQSPITPVASSPMTPVNNPPPRWGGGEYSQPAVWQPGQPVSAAAQASMQGNRMPPQPGQMPPGQRPAQQGQMPPQPGQLPSAQMSARPSQMPPKPSQATPVQQGPRPQQPAPPTAPISGPRAPAPPATTPFNAAPPHNAAPPMGAQPRVEPARVAASNIPRQQNPPIQEAPPPAPVNVSRPPEPVSIPQPKAPEPPRPVQAPISNLAPHPGLSDLAPSSISGVSSQRRDSLSDAGSITTIEVSEAKPQPVLRPSIVQVHRRSTDMFRKSQEIQRSIEAQAAEDAARGSSETARTAREPQPVQQAHAPTANFQPQQPNYRPDPTPQFNGPDRALSPAPLFSKFSSTAPIQNGPPAQENRADTAPKPSGPTPGRTGLPSQQQSRFEIAPAAKQEPVPKPASAPKEDKWAKKPVVDYSGGDWGDDDDWDY
ncbi:hypothetical protein FALBO_2579 [Fusarium albosuccineum]|uniref:WW domain-containing protein n=1 Tax=Fusarium albosuccineum TaxID=1237068 RepID=A0A8H4LLA8_9HYPO|nr:hypothetical protein FALBO_2579 [Fusarium albosuccineum]